MNQKTIQKLNKVYADFPFSKATKPALIEDVKLLESNLGFDLPEDYKQFLSLYGAGSVGRNPIFGFGSSKDMGLSQGSAWDETLLHREQKWQGTENWLVFSVDRSGNPIGLDCNGAVWVSDHNYGSIDKLADSFEDYLWKWCWDE